jgi:hypothetical protein
MEHIAEREIDVVCAEDRVETPRSCAAGRDAENHEEVQSHKEYRRHNRFAKSLDVFLSSGYAVSSPHPKVSPSRAR